MIGATPPNISELTRSSERLSYIYVEHATIHRADNAITVTEERGVTHIPAASLSALLLGPGTRITHQAMTLLGECGTFGYMGGRARGALLCARTVSSTFLSITHCSGRESIKYSFSPRSRTHYVCMAFPR